MKSTHLKRTICLEVYFHDDGGVCPSSFGHFCSDLGEPENLGEYDDEDAASFRRSLARWSVPNGLTNWPTTNDFDSTPYWNENDVVLPPKRPPDNVFNLQPVDELPDMYDFRPPVRPGSNNNTLDSGVSDLYDNRRHDVEGNEEFIVGRSSGDYLKTAGGQMDNFWQQFRAIDAEVRSIQMEMYLRIRL